MRLVLGAVVFATAPSTSRMDRLKAIYSFRASRTCSGVTVVPLLSHWLYT